MIPLPIEKSNTLKDLLSLKTMHKTNSMMAHPTTSRDYPATTHPPKPVTSGLQKRKLSPQLNPARADQEERKGQPKQANANPGIYDYMRDTFYNISYMYKGGLDRKQLARSLNSINDNSLFFKAEKQQKPVAYILNEKFNPTNVRSSRYFN